MPKCALHTKTELDATPMADSRINDQLIKCIHSSIRRVEAHQLAILLSAAFSTKYLIPHNY